MKDDLLLNKIRQLSKKKGVIAFSATSFEPCLGIDRLKIWLSMGYHASMKYMEKRLKTAFPEDARTILSFAFPYNTKRDVSAHLNKGRGWISKYAWGRDYHHVIKKGLTGLSGVLEKEGFWTKIFVDTAPLLEKPHAERAGLGFIGKNTCLIHPRYGSFLFLGAILTNWKYEEKGNSLNISCGTCKKCIDACPTNALEEPGILDSRKCISYWTIEHRGPFPEGLFSLHGNLFGCDICQEVCPFNNGAPLSTISDFNPKEGLLSPQLIRIADMDYQEWDILTQGTPLRRAGFLGLKRNARYLIGKG